jgi:dihydrofolate reductase
MRQLSSFIQVSLDGCFAGPNGELDWAHKDPSDAEWNAFVTENAKGGGALLFGRKTDGFQILVCPLVLGPGKRLFEGIGGTLDLQLTQSRAFGNGSVLLCYSPG